ncbi:hypothetical protein H7F33_10995 [Pedobacter sp. PAMC26386]|nr:hypothetical protein H7F33_10995 [Pedobacter sp. PAMC26386]
MAFTWYVRTLGADPNSPSSYTSVGTVPPSCPGTGKICAIFADESDIPNEPSLDDELKSEMVTALNTNSDQTRVLLRSAN